jgi:hypothetical protein
VTIIQEKMLFIIKISLAVFSYSSILVCYIKLKSKNNRENKNGRTEQKRILIKTKHISTDPSMEFPFPAEK